MNTVDHSASNATIARFVARENAKRITHAGKANVGDTIRAYEFQPMPGRNDCYHEGVVIEAAANDHGFVAYKIRCTRHVFDGKECPETVGDTILVPHRVSLMEYEHRVIKML